MWQLWAGSGERRHFLHLVNESKIVVTVDIVVIAIILVKPILNLYLF